MKPCKHLDHESEFIACELRDISQKFPNCEGGVKYWERVAPHIEAEGLPRNVQFCKLRGRINGIFACYNEGEMSCYEQEETQS